MADDAAAVAPKDAPARAAEIAPPVPRLAARGPSAWLRAGRVLLFATVLGYLGLVLVAPVVALVEQLVSIGAADAFRDLLTPDALRAVGISVSLVVISVGINAVVGTVGAIAIVRHRFPGRAAIDALADLPLAVSPVMIGLAFLLLVGRDGVLGPALAQLEIAVAFAYPGLVVATLFVTLPFTLREVVYVLEQLGVSEEEAAVTLGASPLETFFRVTLPNIRPALGYGLLMTVARSLGEFGAVLVLGGSISGKTQTATTFIHDAIEERMQGAAYAMAVVLSLASAVLLLALDRAKHAARKKFERA